MAVNYTNQGYIRKLYKYEHFKYLKSKNNLKKKKKLYKIFLEIKFHNGNIKEGIFYYTPIP